LRPLARHCQESSSSECPPPPSCSTAAAWIPLSKVVDIFLFMLLLLSAHQYKYDDKYYTEKYGHDKYGEHVKLCRQHQQLCGAATAPASRLVCSSSSSSMLLWLFLADAYRRVSGDAPHGPRRCSLVINSCLGHGGQLRRVRQSQVLLVPAPVASTALHLDLIRCVPVVCL
jgi:hypothetical protein